MTVEVFDNYLEIDEQAKLNAFLNGPGWGYGAYSHSGSQRSCYWFKHFAGVSGGRASPDILQHIHDQAEKELEQFPPIKALWEKLRGSSRLLRCYANGYPIGAEGGVHVDSNKDGFYTWMYYPHLQWHADWAGETLFFNASKDEVVKAVYPKPNRLVKFHSPIPHVARGISRLCPILRITLMFKVAHE